MKNLNPRIDKLIICCFTISLVVILTSVQSNAQYTGIDESIAKHRKGNITIRVKKGSQVTVEQIRHQFWFGCATPNSLAESYMSEDNKKIFKELFLQHFNSAVTENAVKWAIMERN